MSLLSRKRCELGRLEALEDRRLLANEPIIISEFLAINDSTLADDDGLFADWIELQNLSNDAVSLSGWHLTDSMDNPQRWSFPDVSINANEHLVVFASAKDRAATDAQLHTNFKLAGDGEYLALIRADGTVASDFGDQYPLQSEDQSYGIGPDGAVHYFSTPTPGSPNNDDYADQVAPTEFSVASGFFDDPIELTLSNATAGATIYFTVDGSEPTVTNGERYVSPIDITESTVVRAVSVKAELDASEIATHTYLYLDDVIEQSSSFARSKGFPSSWGTEFSDYAMDRDIVGQNGTDRYRGRYAETVRDDLLAAPTLSLVMDVDDLFGTRGIYSNPDGRGFLWERPTSVEWIDPRNGDNFHVDAGIRIQGGISRVVSPKKSMRLLFKNQYGDATLDFPIFGSDNADRFDSLPLRGSGGEVFVGLHYIRDKFVRQLQRDTGNPSPNSQFVHLYLNGIYWGMYETTERPDARFAASYFGGSKDDYDVLNAGDLGSESVTAIAGTDAAWRRLVTQAERVRQASTTTAKRDAYFQIQGKRPDGTNNPNTESLLDVDNYIDYLIVNWFVANSDWPHRNYYMARQRGPDSTGFKFFVWDAEFTFSPGADVITPFLQNADPGPAQIFAGLYSSEDFRLRFSERLTEHFSPGGALYVSPISPQWDPDSPENNAPAASYAAIVDQTEEPLVAETARWGDAFGTFGPIGPQTFTVDEVWRNDVAAIFGFLETRTAPFMDQMERNALYRPAPEVQHDSGPIVAGTAISLSTSDDVIYFTRDGSDPRRADGGVNPAAESYNVGRTSEILIQRRSVWKYLDDGSNQGTEWRNRTFDDSSWESGAAELGYGDGDEATEIGFGINISNKHITSYFRHRFSVSDPNGIDELIVNLIRDDGAAVYLNGNQLFRDNLPNGLLSSSTLASSAIGGAAERAIQRYVVSADTLLAGENVIAVEIHQANRQSSDISFDLELNAIRVTSADQIVIDQNTTIRARSRSNSNWSELAEARFLTDGVLANAQNLRITEVNYNPRQRSPAVDTNLLEYVELQNISGSQIDLAGIQFVDGIDFRFAPRSLDPNERVVVIKDKVEFLVEYGFGVNSVIAEGTGQILDDDVFAGQLDNEGESIRLVDLFGNTIHDFRYNDGGSWPGRADGNGSSLEIVDFSADYNDSENWRSSVDFDGSPGQAGSLNVNEIVINEILAHTDLPQVDAIELHNRSDNPVEIGHWFLSDNNSNYSKFQIPDGTLIPAGGYAVFTEEDFNATAGLLPNEFSFSSFGDNAWLISADENGVPIQFKDHVEFLATLNGVSIGRQPNGDPTSPMVALSQPTLGAENSGHRIPELLVSEIHFDPNGEDQNREFIELFNNSSQIIDLSDWRIRGAVDIDLPDQSLLSGQTIVLVPFAAEDAVEAEVFRAQFDAESSVLIGPWDAGDTLPEGRGTISVQRKTDDVRPGGSTFSFIEIERIEYQTDVPWTSGANGTGLSIHRNGRSSFGNDPMSWFPSFPSPGKTVFDGSVPGDFNGDNEVDVIDVDQLCAALLGQDQDRLFDVNSDGTVDRDDWIFLINDILGTHSGDANLDGIFNSRDLVAVFVSGEYEDGIAGNSNWAEGDWNCDGEFSSRDLVWAFQSEYSEESRPTSLASATDDRLFSRKSSSNSPNLH